LQNFIEWNDPPRCNDFHKSYEAHPRCEQSFPGFSQGGFPAGDAAVQSESTSDSPAT
jgi:hypothetical protein